MSRIQIWLNLGKCSETASWLQHEVKTRTLFFFKGKWSHALLYNLISCFHKAEDLTLQDKTAVDPKVHPHRSWLKRMKSGILPLFFPFNPTKRTNPNLFQCTELYQDELNAKSLNLLFLRQQKKKNNRNKAVPSLILVF